MAFIVTLVKRSYSNYISRWWLCRIIDKYWFSGRPWV